MKKILPVLVLGILVLSGFGAVAISNEKNTATSSTTQKPEYLPEYLIEIKGGFRWGVTAIITVTHGEPPEELACEFTIEATVMILGRHNTVMFNPQPEPPVEIRSRLLLGFGTAGRIGATLLDGDQILAETTASGFVLGPFLLVQPMDV